MLYLRHDLFSPFRIPIVSSILTPLLNKIWSFSFKFVSQDFSILSRSNHKKHGIKKHKQNLIRQPKGKYKTCTLKDCQTCNLYIRCFSRHFFFTVHKNCPPTKISASPEASVITTLVDPITKKINIHVFKEDYIKNIYAVQKIDKNFFFIFVHYRNSGIYILI